MTAIRAAEVEVLFTANDKDVARAEKSIRVSGERIEKNPIKIDADPRAALAGMDRVEDAAKKLVSERAVVKLDADIDRAEKNLQRAVDKLEDLHVRAEGGLDVTADVKRAEASIQRLERNLKGLQSARTKVDVEVGVEPDEAESNLKRFLARFKRQTEEAGAEGGASLTKGLDSATRGAGQAVGKAVGGDIEDTLVSALAAIPIAGGIILGAVAIGKAVVGGIQDGMAVDKRQDRLQALTGLTEADARRLSYAAGEAYAGTFGESIEANMNTARLALQFDILDESATTRDAERVISGLSGIAELLEEDVRRTATTVTTLLKTGLAGSAEEAFDLLATGAREGVNRAEDLLDTFTEYPVVLRRLGLQGDEALGLLNQGLTAGARNSDVVADALKEFQIRATDASDASAAGYERIGLSAEDMTAKIARGGTDAREGLQEVLDALRATEDPVQRNAAAVELFGTKAEDLGEALFALDLTTAVEQLDGVTGSAQRMFDTLADNDATKLERAKRNIDVAVQGIQGALAGAFSDPLADAADWISQNRGPMLQFFLDLANGALDFASSATTGFGEFVSGPLADMVDGLATVIDALNGFEGKPPELVELADGMRGFDDTTAGAVERIEEMRGKLNDFAEPAVALGFVNDAALRTADALGKVGVAADGSALGMESFLIQSDGAVVANAALAEQLRGAVGALQAEIDAAALAGESQENLQRRYDDTTGALISQLEQMGLTRGQAEQLIATYGAVPTMVTTNITANTADAQGSIDRLVTNNNGREIKIRVRSDGSVRMPDGREALVNGRGNVVEFMARGGLPGLTPMDPVAQMVPANTFRVVGDRGDVPELFTPLDGEPRSWALLMEGLRRMPGSPVGMAPASPQQAAAPVQFGDVVVRADGLSRPEAISMIRQAVAEAVRDATRQPGGS